MERGAVQGRTWGEGLHFTVEVKEEPRRCWERSTQRPGKCRALTGILAGHSQWGGGKMEGRTKKGIRKKSEQFQGGLTGQQNQSHRNDTNGKF